MKRLLLLLILTPWKPRGEKAGVERENWMKRYTVRSFAEL
jgi:hypothetical protein